jgi:putative copper resistance protein D
MTDALVVMRSLHFAATVIASGTMFFSTFVFEPALGRRRKLPSTIRALRNRFRWIVWIGLTVAALSGLGWLVLLASDILGASVADVCLHGGLWPVLSDTRFGLVWALRLLLAGALALSINDRQWNVLSIALAAAFLGSIALVGHAGATPGLAGRVHLASDVLHLIAAGAWLGGLLPLAMVLACVKNAHSGAGPAIVVLATRRFSVLGIVAVGALLLSGVVNTWNLVGSFSALITTDYGRLVTLKIGLFAAMVGIATVNRFALTPRLPARGAAQALKRNAFGELALGLCAIVFVGVLGTMPPAAHHHFEPTQIPADAAFVHIHTDTAMAEVTVMPGHPGTARAVIRLLGEDFTPFEAKEVALSVVPAGQPPTNRAAASVSDGTWQLDGLALPQAGTFTVTVTITASGGPPFILDAPIVIDR